MRTYSIKELENYSGIKAHTIRIWEQRYNLLSPKRTPTGIRYYNDEDLKKILAISVLLKSGYKISKVAKLSKDELNLELSKIEDNNIDNNTKYEKYINSLLAAGILFNEKEFNYHFKKAQELFDLLEIYENIIYPLLMKIGAMWGKDDMNPIQEHFISNLIRQKILKAIDEIEEPNSNREIILFLPEKETHEIGLLIANFILKKEGLKTFYFGQQTPVKNLVNFINDKGIKEAIAFVFYSQGKDKFLKFFKLLDEKCKNTTFYWGGLQSALELLNSNHKTFSSIEDFRNLVINK